MSKLSFNDFKIGLSYSKKFNISESMVNNYAKNLGDMNPLHVDQQFAKKSIFGNKICHGTLLTGLVSTILGVNFPGEGTILIEISSKFLAPVFVGEDIKIFLKVVKIDHLKNNLTLNFYCNNSSNAKVFEGDTKVKYKKNESLD